MKITDTFVWHEVTNKAKDIFNNGLFELFWLHEDGSDSLIETPETLNMVLESGDSICIEVGHLPKEITELKEEFEKYKKESIKWVVDDFLSYDQDEYDITEEQAQTALESMIYHHDASEGINWETIYYYIEEFGTTKSKPETGSTSTTAI